MKATTDYSPVSSKFAIRALILGVSKFAKTTIHFRSGSTGHRDVSGYPLGFWLVAWSNFDLQAPDRLRKFERNSTITAHCRHSPIRLALESIELEFTETILLIGPIYTRLLSAKVSM